MRYQITTSHADYEKLFGGPMIVVEYAKGDCTVVEAAGNAALIGESIEISESGDIAEQLAAMYSAEVEPVPYFIIQGHADDEIGPDYNWDESYAGSETIRFSTHEEASAGIKELRKCGDDFAAADWRVFEVED